MSNHSISYSHLLTKAADLSVIAGKEILKVYSKSDFQVEVKDDQSPLTLADKKSHDVIIRGLKSTEIPVLSEESSEISWKQRREWNQYWLVDPLDGTKEFIKRNDEFTVNIALIEEGNPVLGVIYIPVFDVMYFALKESGAFKLSKPGMSNSENSSQELMQKATKLPAYPYSGKIRVVASRSHLSTETSQFIEDLEKNHGDVSIVAAGSSLKLCLIAEGNAEIYPRMGPTMEWDIAAGHVIITESGGSISKTDDTLLEYNKQDLLNPWFIARSKSFLKTDKLRTK